MVWHKVDPGRAAHRILSSAKGQDKKKGGCASGIEQKLVLSKKRKKKEEGLWKIGTKGHPLAEVERH